MNDAIVTTLCETSIHLIIHIESLNKKQFEKHQTMCEFWVQ